jgi:hypothetical protein
LITDGSSARATAVGLRDVVHGKEALAVHDVTVAAGAGVAIKVAVSLQRNPLAYVTAQGAIVSHEQVCSAVGFHQPELVRRALEAPGDLAFWTNLSWISGV